jgi:hypothetical protein
MLQDQFGRNEQRRIAAAGWAAGLAAAALMLRTFPPSHYAFYPSCPIRSVTGLLCPGCGGTRAIAALLRGDLVKAWRLNALVVAMVPLWLAYGLGMLRRTWHGEPAWVRLPLWVWFCFVALATVFTVWRNAG